MAVRIIPPFRHDPGWRQRGYYYVLGGARSPHVPDPDVRLQVPFAGNVSDDISIYEVPADESDIAPGVIEDGYFKNNGDDLIQAITYVGDSISIGAAQPWTLEGFVYTDGLVDPNTAGQAGFLTINQIDGPSSVAIHLCMVGNNNASNVLGALQVRTPVQSIVVSPDTTPAIGGTIESPTHIAIVSPGDGGDIRAYRAGTKDFEFADPYFGNDWSPAAADHVQIGSWHVAMNNTPYGITGVRLTFRELYTGTSFTPPTLPLPIP